MNRNEKWQKKAESLLSLQVLQLHTATWCKSAFDISSLAKEAIQGRTMLAKCTGSFLQLLIIITFYWTVVNCNTHRKHSLWTTPVFFTLHLGFVLAWRELISSISWTRREQPHIPIIGSDSGFSGKRKVFLGLICHTNVTALKRWIDVVPGLSVSSKSTKTSN